MGVFTGFLDTGLYAPEGIRRYDEGRSWRFILDFFRMGDSGWKGGFEPRPYGVLCLLRVSAILFGLFLRRRYRGQADRTANKTLKQKNNTPTDITHTTI